MIEAGDKSYVHWSNGIWVFLDIGFARDARTCGLLIGNGTPSCVQFGEAKRQIVRLIQVSNSLVNLVIEAPLSVCFSSGGNPKGRAIEKEGSKTRYWYNGLGCAIMVASMYLIRDIHDAKLPTRVRLFEGFVSYKRRDVKSDHKRDVLILRNVICDPIKFADSIYDSSQLKQHPTDVLSCAFCVAGLECGVPAVIKPSAEPAVAV
jgi:hypothetical protein